MAGRAASRQTGAIARGPEGALPLPWRCPGSLPSTVLHGSLCSRQWAASCFLEKGCGLKFEGNPPSHFSQTQLWKLFSHF